RLALPLFVVLVEALAGLHAELAREVHALEQRGRRPPRIAELVEEHVRDVVVDVHAGVVDELERSHRMAQPELHRLVDVLDGRDAQIVAGGQTRSSSANTSFFGSMTSMTASMTRSRSLNSASDVVPRIRPRAVFASSSLSFPDFTTRASDPSMRFIPPSMN